MFVSFQQNLMHCDWLQIFQVRLNTKWITVRGTGASSCKDNRKLVIVVWAAAALTENYNLSSRNLVKSEHTMLHCKWTCVSCFLGWTFKIQPSVVPTLSTRALNPLTNHIKKTLMPTVKHGSCSKLATDWLTVWLMTLISILSRNFIISSIQVFLFSGLHVSMMWSHKPASLPPLIFSLLWV